MRCLAAAAASMMLLLSACGPAAEPPATPESATIAPEAVPASGPAAEPQADTAPTPYTSAQIRDATKVGRTYEFVIERPDGPPARRRMVFVAVSADRATTESVMIDHKGVAAGAPERTEATWDELRDHAKYPKASTTIEKATATTPAGTFPCQRYTVLENGAGGETRTIACFADELPGPPVEMRKEVGGKMVMTMTLLRHDAGAAAK
jgi:hypothetical protein